MDLESLPAVITAISILLASIGALVAGIITALRTGRVERKTATIEANVNGATHTAAAVKVALEQKVDRLEEKLVAALADKLEAAWLAKEAAGLSERAAADVRAERAAPAKPPAEEEGR